MSKQSALDDCIGSSRGGKASECNKAPHPLRASYGVSAQRWQLKTHMIAMAMVMMAVLVLMMAMAVLVLTMAMAAMMF